MSWQKTLIQEVGTRGLNPHLTGSMRIEKERTREDKRTLPVISRPTRHGSGRGLKERRQIPRSLDPHHLIGHHGLCATRSALAISRFHSGAVVTMRTIEMRWSKWHKHTRWLGRTKEQRRAKEQKCKGAKEVEPDDHSEATRGHELYPHGLASISSMMGRPLVRLQ